MSDATPPAKEVLPWPRFGEAARDLAREVHDSGWMPDLVVAVARGGLIPAGAISYALGVKAMGTMNVEFYTDIAETLPDPVVLPPLLDTSVLAGAKVLVVDDVADSGRTLDVVMNLLRQGSPGAGEKEAIDAAAGSSTTGSSAAGSSEGAGIRGRLQVQEAHLPSEARSAVLYTKPRSIIEPDFTWRRTERWISFPWSAQPPVTEADNTEA